MKEVDLYPPLKHFFERQGFTVKSEIHHCDLIAQRADEPLLAVELKRSLNLEVVLQAVDRTRSVDTVYIAVPEAGGRARIASRSGRRKIQRMLRMLGIGLITVGLRTPGGKTRAIPRIEVLIEPGPYQPRRNAAHRHRLNQEFEHRIGDFNNGGSHRTRLVTGYRQDALLCAQFLARHGASAPSQVKRATGVERAGALMYRDVYGWFERPARGQYALRESGQAALLAYQSVLDALRAP